MKAIWIIDIAGITLVIVQTVLESCRTIDMQVFGAMMELMSFSNSAIQLVHFHRKITKKALAQAFNA